MDGGTIAPVRKRTFTVRDVRDREEIVIRHLRSLPLERAYQVTVAPYRRRRTVTQNNRFHKWIDMLRDELGYDVWDSDRLKEEIKIICDCPETEYVGLDGTTRRERRTSKLDSGQMMDFEERVLRWAVTELGIRLPVTKEDFARADV